jgi:hypothetical protein
VARRRGRTRGSSSPRREQPRRPARRLHPRCPWPGKGRQHPHRPRPAPTANPRKPFPQITYRRARPAAGPQNRCPGPPGPSAMRTCHSGTQLDPAGPSWTRPPPRRRLHSP